MADRGWRIEEKHGKWTFNFLDEVIPIVTTDLIMQVKNVNPSGHREGQCFFFFFSISTLGFHSVISATLLHIFPVQKVPFGVNKTLI